MHFAGKYVCMHFACAWPPTADIDLLYWEVVKQTMFVCMYAYVYVRSMYAYAWIYLYIWVCNCACISIHGDICVYVYICM